MKTPDPPKEEMNIDPRTYQEITKVIKYMSSSASSSPIDQISIIFLRNCLITRTLLTKIIAYSWEHQHFPKKWKNSVTVLAYKSAPTSDPGNFTPISL